MVAAAVGEDDLSHDFVVNPFKIREYDRDFANSLISIVKEHRLKARLLKDCKGSGRALVKLIKDEADKAKPKEKTLAYTDWQSFAMRPFVGELNMQTFEAHYDEYEMLRNRVPESMRGPAVHVIEHLNKIMYLFDDISNLYSVNLKVEKPDPGDLEAHLVLIRSSLTDRRTSKKLSEVVSGGSGMTLSTHLAKEGYTQAQIKTILAATSTADPVKTLVVPPSGGWLPAPRDADGNITGWIAGMEPCKCGVGGGRHLHRDRSAGCTLPAFSTGGGKGRNAGRKSRNGSRDDKPTESKQSNASEMVDNGTGVGFKSLMLPASGEIDSAMASQIHKFLVEDSTASSKAPTKTEVPIKTTLISGNLAASCDEETDQIEVAPGETANTTSGHLSLVHSITGGVYDHHTTILMAIVAVLMCLLFATMAGSAPISADLSGSSRGPLDSRGDIGGGDPRLSLTTHLAAPYRATASVAKWLGVVLLSLSLIALVALPAETI